MSNAYAQVTHHPIRAGGLIVLALIVAVTAVFVARNDTRAAPPSSFMEQGPVIGTQDANIKYDLQAGSFDWANSGACTTTAGTVSCAGTGGLFNGGHFNGNTTPPNAPAPTANGTVGTNFIDAIAFGVDPLVTDTGACSPPGSQSPPCTPPQQACGTGDPTVYTGAGGEKNGDALIGKGVETYSLASVPPKDDVQNIYAVSRTGFGATNDGKEVFFGGERNFTSGQGDSHFDFEFLQAAVTLVPGADPCKNGGSFNGHRTEGDFVASIDYTQGGSLGGFELHQWHCNTDPTDSQTGSQPANGTQCDTASPCSPASACAGKVAFGSGPHYQIIACSNVDPKNCPASITGVPAGVADAVNAVTNGTAAVACGGWICRDVNGAPETTVDVNKFFEGGVNLKSLGFNQCLSTFIPHTRSSQSFTATLKDFELIPFNTCKTALNIKKVFDDTTTLLSGATFQITPDPTGANGTCAIGNVSNCLQITDDGTGDKDPTDGIVCVDGISPGTFTVKEVAAPAGYIGDPNSQTKTISGPLSTNTTCPGTSLTFTFSNNLGTLQWEKRSDVDGKLQTGASFTVTPNPFDCIQPPVSAIESPILDNAGSDADPDNGQYLINNVCLNSDGTARTYTITETVAPTGFAIDPDATRTCVVAADNPATTTKDESKCVVGTAPLSGLMPNPPNDVVDNCHPASLPKIDGGPAGSNTGSDFCDPVGKLRFLKVAKDATSTTLCPGSTTTHCSAFGGASFTVKDTATNGTAFSTTVTDNGTNDLDSAAGRICIGNVPLGVAMTITETASNNVNYVKDSTTRSGTQNSSGTCSGDSSVDVTSPFVNTPLSAIEVTFDSLAGPGKTAANITCTGQTEDSTTTPPGDNTGENGNADPAFDDTHEIFTGLVPGTYNCQVVIDP